jgi:FdhD protein
VIGSTCAAFTDALSIEETMEIRLVVNRDAKPADRSLAITVRMPGDDRDLAAGFLFHRSWTRSRSTFAST